MLSAMHTLPSDPTAPLSPADIKEIDRQVAALDVKISDATGAEANRLQAEKTALLKRKQAASSAV
jgi:hypothetical protein